MDAKNIKLKQAWKKRIIIGFCIAIFVAVIVPVVSSVILYEKYLDERYTTDEAFRFSLSDFTGLQAQRYEFTSDSGQTLTGYQYYREEQKPEAVVIMAHGFGGGGHNTYMDCANFFASNGFTVFAFDCTGNDESEGNGVGGLPQGVIDLDYAISFVESCRDFENLPIVLFGHSWGAYSVCSVLTYHPEVKAVAALSGFNCSSDLVEAQGKEMVGGLIKVLMPYVNLWERIKFGRYAVNTAMDGFEDSDAAVLIIHSSDDITVPKEYGYDIYHAVYENNTRFRFMLFENRGHDTVFYSEDYRAYWKDLVQSFSEYSSEYMTEDRTNEEKVALRREWLETNFDRSEYIRALDDELLSQIADFYITQIGAVR